MPLSRDITLRLFFYYHRRLAYDQFYVSMILQALLEAACLPPYTSKELTIVRRNSLLATMLNSKNNLIPILNPWRQLIPGGFNLPTIALIPEGKPSGLKDYNDLNKVDTDNVLSFINYTTTDK